MRDLELRKPRLKLSQVRLSLEKTDIPWDALPTGEKGEHLTLPTPARLSLTDEGLRIEMIVQDPEERYEEYYREPDFDDREPPIISLKLEKREILRLIISDDFKNPTAVLFITDPGEVVDSLRLTFASTDPNHPLYPVLALAKMLREALGITIEDRSKDPNGDVPF